MGVYSRLSRRRCCGAVLVAQSYPVTGKPLVVKVGLKPTYNLLLLRDLVYRMICFRKHFHILLELPFELLPTLSTCYAHVRLDASTIFTISCSALRLSKSRATTNSVFLNGICSKLALIILSLATTSVRCLMSTADVGI